MNQTAALHVIVGAGAVGTALAGRLLGERKRVRVVTRSGTGLGIAGVESVVVDASDSEALTANAKGAEVLYNCASPGPYPTWEKQWPPLAASILAAAERTGAVLVAMSNLYAHGPVTAQMTRHTPAHPSDHKGTLRARMWQDALTAHRAGRVRVTEARASDYIGPTVTISNGLLPRYADATLTGKTATVFADPDQPHTWTAIDDVAATLAIIGRDQRAWGSPWIVPSNPPRTMREVLRELNHSAGRGEPRLRQVPRWMLRAGGLALPLLREVHGIIYQFDAPFIADGTETTETFGTTPSPWEPLIETTANAWTQRTHHHNTPG